MLRVELRFCTGCQKATNPCPQVELGITSVLGMAGNHKMKIRPLLQPLACLCAWSRQADAARNLFTRMCCRWCSNSTLANVAAERPALVACGAPVLHRVSESIPSRKKTLNSHLCGRPQPDHAHGSPPRDHVHGSLGGGTNSNACPRENTSTGEVLPSSGGLWAQSWLSSGPT